MDRPSRPKPKKHRARLLMKGYTVQDFAVFIGEPVSTVKAALRGERRSLKSRAILAKIQTIPTREDL